MKSNNIVIFYNYNTNRRSFLCFMRAKQVFLANTEANCYKLLLANGIEL